MCLLIYKPAHVELSADAMRDFYHRNPDGFGIMYLDGGRVRTHKIIAGPKKIARLYERYARGRECALHWRYATHGSNTRGNTHPHSVTEKLWLMHNGVLSQFSRQVGRDSDTAVFARTLRETVEEQRGEKFHLASSFVKAMEEIVGSENRLIFLSPDAGYQIVNEHRGVWYQGAWYSNTYAWTLPAELRARQWPSLIDADAEWISDTSGNCLAEESANSTDTRDTDTRGAYENAELWTPEQEEAMDDLYSWAQACDPQLISPDWAIKEIARAHANTRRQARDLESWLYLNLDGLRYDLAVEEQALRRPDRARRDKVPA